MLQVAATPSYSAESLLHLIGSPTTEIPDDIVTAALNLMKANSPPDGDLYVGHFLPAQIKWWTQMCNEVQPDFIETIPMDKSSINIHPLTGHWVTSFYNKNTKELCVYDSLMTDSFSRGDQTT